jgi:hypothetical protein
LKKVESCRCRGWLALEGSYIRVSSHYVKSALSSGRIMGMKLYALSTAFLSSVVKSQNQTAFVSATGRVSISTLINGSTTTDTDGMPERNPSAADPLYPGTAVERLQNVHRRVAELAQCEVLNGPWEDVRRRLLWAGGLRDLPNALPGQVRNTA